MYLVSPLHGMPNLLNVKTHRGLSVGGVPPSLLQEVVALDILVAFFLLTFHSGAHARTLATDPNK